MRGRRIDFVVAGSSSSSFLRIQEAGTNEVEELGILGKLLSCHFVVIFFFFFFFRAKFVSPESWLKASSLWKVIPPFLNSSFVASFRSRLAVDASINPKIVDLPPRDKYVEEFQIWRKKTGSLFLPPWLMIYAWLRFCLPAEVNKHFKELGFRFVILVSFFDLLNVSQLLSSSIPCLLPALIENLFAVAAPCHPQGTVWSF